MVSENRNTQAVGRRYATAILKSLALVVKAALQAFY
ncbi:hypothetical protein CEXT_672471, partial [Caerostris extrusa]